MLIFLKNKNIIFLDLDDTLCLYQKYYDNTLQYNYIEEYHYKIINVVKELKFLNKKIILVSYNIYPHKILKKMNILNYFYDIIYPIPYYNTKIYNDKECKYLYYGNILYAYPLKSVLINEFMQNHEIYDPTECIFFDNELYNIKDVKYNSYIESIKVDSYTGIDIDNLVY